MVYSQQVPFFYDKSKLLLMWTITKCLTNIQTAPPRVPETPSIDFPETTNIRVIGRYRIVTNQIVRDFSMIYIYSENFSQKRRPKKIAKINIHIMNKQSTCIY